MSAASAPEPRAELHLHLRGAMPAELFGRLLSKYPIAELAAEAPPRFLELFLAHPHLREFLESEDEPPPPERLFDYRDFEGFLASYLFSSMFVRSLADFRELIAAVRAGLARDGVSYAEITVSVPEYLMYGLPLEGLTEALSEGAAERAPRVVWIVDLVRNFGPEAGMTLLEKLLRDRPDGWVGITLGGSEHQFPPGPFRAIYEKARAEGLKLTVHAGEARGPESVWEAIRELGVDRIGHGVRAIEDPKLVDYLADRQIPLEVCPTSNLRTGVYAALEDHPLPRLHRAGVPVTISTDDPAFFATTLADELALAERMGLDAAELAVIARNAWRFAFAPAD